jgi:DNA-binding winged helix-turn-helix (wHTH) protein
MQVTVKSEESSTGDAIQAGLRAAGFEVGGSVGNGNGDAPLSDIGLVIAVGDAPPADDHAVVVALPHEWATDRQVRIAADIAGALRQTADRGLPSDAIIVGDVVIDVDGHAVSRKGVPIDLTHREFLLLTLLAQHPNRVLDRDNLMERLWGPEAVTPNTIEVHISSLRRKLEAFGPRMIFTVRRVGYVLRPGGAVGSRGTDAAAERPGEPNGRDSAILLDRDELQPRDRQALSSAAN